VTCGPFLPSPLGANLDPQGSNSLFAHPLFWGWKRVPPRRQCSPLGANVTPRGQCHPWGQTMLLKTGLRLGEFSPNGRTFTLDSCLVLNSSSSTNFWGTVLHGNTYYIKCHRFSLT
jgi:hypothetical protein